MELNIFKSMKKDRVFLTTKMTIGFFVVIVLLGALIFFCCRYYSLNSAKEHFKQHTESCAKSVANSLYNTDFKAYLKFGKTETYKEQLSVVNSICRNFNLKYIYVYIPDFEKNEVTTLFYVDGKNWKNVENRDLGTKVSWNITRQEKDAFNGLESRDMFYTDNQMGHTMTSYAPVRNERGEVIALVGADLDYESFHRQILFDIARIIVFITFFLVLIYIVLISYLKVVFINPVVSISNKMANFVNNGEAEYTPIEINSDDEFGLMAKSFNKMVVDINSYIKRISDTQMETIFSLAKLAQSRDDDTGKHIVRVQNYCEILARALAETPKFKEKINETFIKNLVSASTLHDIGKVGISDLVLLKNGKLTDEEFEIIKKHTTIGYETLKDAHSKFKSNAFIEMGMYIALYHHERWDGKGYPTGIKGEEIPLEARIMSIADVYDALGTKRVYKPAFPQEKCVEIIKEGSGTQFDPDIVDVFLTVADKFYEVRCSMED